MTLITSHEALAGKSISRVESTFEEVAFHFTDGAVAVWRAHLAYGEDLYLTLATEKDLDDYTLKALGVITADEYKQRQLLKQETAARAQEQNERRALAALIAKYGPKEPTCSDR